MAARRERSETAGAASRRAARAWCSDDTQDIVVRKQAANAQSPSWRSSRTKRRPFQSNRTRSCNASLSAPPLSSLPFSRSRSASSSSTIVSRPCTHTLHRGWSHETDTHTVASQKTLLVDCHSSWNSFNRHLSHVPVLACSAFRCHTFWCHCTL